MPDRLWAPWRLAYVEKDATQRPVADDGRTCVFCLPPDGEAGGDRARLVVRREARAFAVLNRYPYGSGHVLVCPRTHVGDPLDLPVGDRAAVDDLLWRTVAAVRAAFRPDGLNVGLNLGEAAGAGVTGHVHWHVLPRWNGDINYVTTLADVRVLPQALDAAWQALAAAFGSAEGGAEGTEGP